jgi:predicted nucleotidyltransferase
MLLLRALGGSRLYGTNGPDSDWDWYEVHDHIRPRQSMNGKQDTIRMPLSKWLLLCEKGTHQALDALWCPASLCEVDKIGAFRANLRIDPWRVADQLERTAFSIQGMKPKHHYRLLHYANRVREQGWYDPTEWGRIWQG